jgi:hypothetical protein
VSRKTTKIVEGSLGFADKGDVVPPSLSYNLSESGTISLTNGNKLAAVDRVTPE